MIIKALIKSNIALNAHPKGCEQNINKQLNEIKKMSNLNIKPLNVLIIGGSSGYGLASRLVLAQKNKAFTYNVSLEAAPSKRLSGSAGFFNNYYFEEYAKNNDIESYDLNIDCFSIEAKHEVINYFKSNNKKIDLIIYSVASGVRVDPFTNIKYNSILKPIGKDYTGSIVDIKKAQLKKSIITPASLEEISNTVKVMGGEDYLLWIKMLSEANILNDNIKTIAYTYIGSPLTYDIYKDGTIGQAKNDLKAKLDESSKYLDKYNGSAHLVAAKSIITKASCYIPTVPLYVGALNMLMKRNGNYESISQHIYRLFNEMIYGEGSIVDNDNIIRLDSYELEEPLQKEIKELLDKVHEDNFYNELNFEEFIKEFLNINGFSFDDIDYDEDIDLDQYKKTME